MYNIFRILIGVDKQNKYQYNRLKVPDYSSSSFFFNEEEAIPPPPPTNKILRVYYIGIPIQQVKK